MDAQLAKEMRADRSRPGFAARIQPKPLGLAGFGVVTATVVIADQLTKAWATAALSDGEPFVIIPRCFQFIHRVNTGAAWSMLREHPVPLMIFAGLVATGFAVWGFRLKGPEQGLRWPLGMILGGAVGNLIDRFRLGHVIDFIDAHWDDVYHFPTFNVADSAICVGMGILILLSFVAYPDGGARGSKGDGEAGSAGK